MEVKFYDKKDGPAGDALDLKAKILSADMKITYAEALALALQMDPEGARQYIEKPNETRIYTETEKTTGDELDQAAKEYMASHNCDYKTAVSAVLKDRPELYE